jgi:hypothetical protein
VLTKDQSNKKVVYARNGAIDLTDCSLLSNGLVFVPNTYSCFVLSRVENYFVIEPKNSKIKFVQENMGIESLSAPDTLK